MQQIAVMFEYMAAGIIGTIGTCVKYTGIKLTHLADYLDREVQWYDKWR